MVVLFFKTYLKIIKIMHDYFRKNNEIEIKHKIKEFQLSKSHHLTMNVVYISVYIYLYLCLILTQKIGLYDPKFLVTCFPSPNTLSFGHRFMSTVICLYGS